MKNRLLSAVLAAMCLSASASPPATTKVKVVPTKITLICPKSAAYPAPVTCAATVNVAVTGIVEFSLDGHPSADVSIAGTSTSVGQNLLSPGTHIVVATYKGDATHSGSSSASRNITITAPKLVLDTSTVVGSVVGASYSARLSVTGGLPNYTWSLANGKLPAGVTLSSDGTISGVPTASGTYIFTVNVADAETPSLSKSVRLAIAVANTVVQSPPPPPPSLPVPLLAGFSSFPDGKVNASYSDPLTVSGGSTPYVWTVSAGALPSGLALSAGGSISGTPSSSGTFNVTVTVKDSATPSQTISVAGSIAVAIADTPPPPPPTGSAKLFLYPAAPVAPRGSYQTVTAIVNGVGDKTVTWTADNGEIVGTNPCVVNEPCTVALHATTPGTYHLKATSNADKSQFATSTITITDSPTPVVSHPRLGGITADMLTALRAKATMSNPQYAALYNNAVTAFNRDNSIWSWSANGGSGQPNSDQTESFKEQDAYLFAFMSMIDPNDPDYKWGSYGRDLWVYFAHFWLDPLNAAYDPATLVYRQVEVNYGVTGNHGADSTEELTLTPDWLMAGGYLSADDQQLTRTYLANAAKQTISYQLTGSRPPTSNYNSAGQFNTGSIWDLGGQIAMGNNYTHSKIMFLTAAALTFNDTAADDPALPNTCSATRYQVCPDGTAGSLHAYWTYLTGADLYKDYALMEDPSVTLPAYQDFFQNLPSMPTCEDSTTGNQVPCFGNGRGGESREGSWYQYSMYRLALAMLSIHSAGYDDPMKYGPQMSLATSSWWDLKSVSDLEFLTYSHYLPQPRFSYFSTGDSLSLDKAPSDFNAQAWLMVEDADLGRKDRTADLEWPVIALTVGGLQDYNINLSNTYSWSNSIPLFLSLGSVDPTAPLIADPRPSLPTDLYSGGNQHIFARSGWDANGVISASEADGGSNTAFSFYCANSYNDHEHETCGGFDVLSKGEYITKTRTVFNDYNMTLATAEHSNEAGYSVPPDAGGCAIAGNCFEYQAALGSDGKGGGQFWHGYQAGQVTLAHAELPGYVAAIVDTTNLYNASAAVGWGAMSGITASSRSLVFLRNSNVVVTLDRGKGAAPAPKRNWMTTTGPVTITGNTAYWPTSSRKQDVYWTSLLPAGAVMTDAGGYETIDVNPNSTDWEAYSHVLVDAGSPTSTQFLAVLQWKGAGVQKVDTVLVQSTSGQTFDGALVGSSLLVFMQDWPATFSTVTYPASGATTQYVSDLTPNTTYTISGSGSPATGATDSAGVLVFASDGTGSITVTGSGSGTTAPPSDPPPSSPPPTTPPPTTPPPTTPPSDPPPTTTTPPDATATLSSITISPSSGSLTVGQTATFTAVGNYSDGSTKAISPQWWSGDSDIVQVDQSGVATAISSGTTGVTAVLGDVGSNYVNVTVNNP